MVQYDAMISFSLIFNLLLVLYIYYAYNITEVIPSYVETKKFRNILNLGSYLSILDFKYFKGFVSNYLIYYPTPISLTYAWSFGCLVTQMISNFFLAMHYTPHVDLIFSYLYISDGALSVVLLVLSSILIALFLFHNKLPFANNNFFHLLCTITSVIVSLGFIGNPYLSLIFIIITFVTLMFFNYKLIQDSNRFVIIGLILTVIFCFYWAYIPIIFVITVIVPCIVLTLNIIANLFNKKFVNYNVLFFGLSVGICFFGFGLALIKYNTLFLLIEMSPLLNDFDSPINVDSAINIYYSFENLNTTNNRYFIIETTPLDSLRVWNSLFNEYLPLEKTPLKMPGLIGFTQIFVFNKIFGTNLNFIIN